MPRRNGPGIALLADQTRRRIVALLALRPRRPSAIAHEVGLSRPATSRQLRLLREAGLVRMVRSRIDGRGYLYSIEPDSHGPITAWLAGTEVGLRGRNHPELDALAGATPMELDAPASSDSHRRSA
jgi:DNA-binding transcriptional ArsR family regulator